MKLRIENNVLMGVENYNGEKSIIIPDGVTGIGPNAFCGCTGLTSVTIPDSVKIISDGAFRGCRGLTSVTIPDSVAKIGGAAFAGCIGLTSVTIPNSVGEIPSNAFEWGNFNYIYFAKDGKSFNLSKEKNANLEKNSYRENMSTTETSFILNKKLREKYINKMNSKEKKKSSELTF